MGKPYIKKADNPENRLKVNLNDYYQDDEHTPKNRVRKEIRIIDDTEYVSIDSARLMQIYEAIRPKDMRFYFYILTQLTDNEIPIKLPFLEMRNYFKLRWIDDVRDAIERLERAGLLFKTNDKSGRYRVNPAFAWIGDRTRYIDPDSLELMKPKPQI